MEAYRRFPSVGMSVLLEYFKLADFYRVISSNNIGSEAANDISAVLASNTTL